MDPTHYTHNEDGSVAIRHFCPVGTTPVDFFRKFRERFESDRPIVGMTPLNKAGDFNLRLMYRDSSRNKTIIWRANTPDPLLESDWEDKLGE